MPPSSLQGRLLWTEPISCCGYRDIACSLIVFLELCWIQMFGYQCTDLGQADKTGPQEHLLLAWGCLFTLRASGLSCRRASIWQSCPLQPGPESWEHPSATSSVSSFLFSSKTKKQKQKNPQHDAACNCIRSIYWFWSSVFFSSSQPKVFFPSICTRNTPEFIYYIEVIYIRQGSTKGGLPWWLRR